MKRFKSNFFIIYAMLVLYLLIKNLFNLDLNNTYIYYIDTFIWFIIFIISVFLTKSKERVKHKYDKIQTVIILAIVYILVYFLSGLIFGFEYNSFSRKFFSILKNLWAFVLPILFQEKIRNILVNSVSKKIKIDILIVLIFVILNINFSTFFTNFSSFELFFKYFFGTLFPLVVEQFVFTYISKIIGSKGILAYRLPIEIIYIIVPVFPKLDWFLFGLFSLINYIAIYLIINYEYVNKDENAKIRYKVRNPIVYLPLLLFIVIFIGFVIGFFEYKPVAIMSNSMKPIFSRGDMVIIQKIDKKDIQKLTIGDIIEYRLDNHIIVHRIIEKKEKNKKLIFKTKGDNNNAPDTKYVSEEQIIGLVKFVAPKIGYPTVWLSEIFTNSKPDVEMG